MNSGEKMINLGILELWIKCESWRPVEFYAVLKGGKKTRWRKVEFVSDIIW